MRCMMRQRKLGQEVAYSSLLSPFIRENLQSFWFWRLLQQDLTEMGLIPVFLQSLDTGEEIQRASSGKLHILTDEEVAIMEPAIRNRQPWSKADERRFGENLALYGRADHIQEAPLTLLDKQKMALR